MLRTRLIVACGVVLALVFGVAGLLLWGTQQIRYHYERSLLAHQVLENYIQLSNDAYRHFKQLADLLVVGGTPRQTDEIRTRTRLQDTLERLRDLTLREVAFVGAREPEEAQELAQIERLEQVIRGGVVMLEEAAAMQQQGEDAAAETKLQEALERFVDQEFADLVDAAIDEEQAEVNAADRQVSWIIDQVARLTALAALVTALVVVVTGFWLGRTIKGPLDQLTRGTREIAQGHLGHRIAVDRPAEFAQLALSFNRMAAEVEQQRGHLLLARADLERKVQERTLDLERANLALQRLDQMRRRMFADISHELRTPLTVIRGEAEVTLRSRPGALAEHRAALERIVELTGQLARLVEDLMLLARSEPAGGARLKLGEVAVGRLLSGVCEDAEVLASDKGVRVDWILPAEEVVVHGDRDRLRQMLLILVDNACRYTDRGAISVAVTPAPPDAVITIADTGIGIAPEEQAAVFERFYRGAAAQKLAPRGSGLGLHVARSIVEAHGGDIALESELGRGTTVTVRLPLANASGAIHERLAG